MQALASGGSNHNHELLQFPAVATKQWPGWKGAEWELVTNLSTLARSGCLYPRKALTKSA